MEPITNISQVQKGSVIILKVKGKLDSILAPSVEKHLIELVNNNQNKLLLDLSEVTTITSAGLRMLLSVKKQVKAAAGSLAVFGLRSEVLEMMKICGFDHVVDITQTEAEALHRL